MPFRFSERSKAKLAGVNPRLRMIAEEAILRSPVDFGVSCGLRTTEQQAVLVETGKSLTMNSKHLTGDAIDIFVLHNGKAVWNIEAYHPVADVFKRVAKEHGIALVWGGDWGNFIDAPHFELGAL